ncbi:F-box/kelch-repeat protein At3g06240-like [Neltuma alba]|uniref:F-box/kelch-repeat protein At3g06240-like n=1 Tax=Neltuma alba TaxID=207710 RepID=UPI0010A58771|nr:F-box/kelch-repeat protein At3g06240-like [Prosopis alba]
MVEQIVMQKETSYLPPEIITNILVRLTVRYLIQFQCVCKDWKNLLKTPSFIEKHLDHSTQQNPLLAFNCSIYESDDNACHLSLNNRDETEVLEFQNPPIVHLLKASLMLVHSSNGLLCLDLQTIKFHSSWLWNPSYSFWLWNPAIREVQQVPQSLDKYKIDTISVGFGFSPIVNDYKIVKLFLLGALVAEVEVYALRRGCWRKVKFGNLEGIRLVSESGFAWNGSIFWIGLEKESHLGLIVSFDIALEVFTLLPFLTESHALKLYDIMFTTYDNKLALLSPTRNHESSFIDLWVMEECTNESKERWVWTKIYRSRPCPRWRLYPMIIWRNEIVCTVIAKHQRGIEDEMEDDEAKVLFCNLTTNEFNVFAFPAKCKFTGQVLNYVESLVPVRSIQIEEP